MEYYREQNKYKDRGVQRLPGPVKFLSAVLLLSKCPKFSIVVRGGAREKTKADDGEGSNDLQPQRDNISVKHPSEGRPLGVKRMQYIDAKQGDTITIAGSIDFMTAALQTSAEGKKQAASIALRLKILRNMPISDGEMNKRLDSLMQEAALLGGEDVSSLHVSSTQSIESAYRGRAASLEPVPSTPSDNTIDLESNLSEHHDVGSNLT